MSDRATTFGDRRQLLQLETLYDLAVALHADRSEVQVLEEVLERVCGILDPAAAAAVTRDAYGRARALALVGWVEGAPSGEVLLADPVWSELLVEGRALSRQGGAFAGRTFTDLLAAPLSYRGVYLGYIALLDKEARGEEHPRFSRDDRRFLVSVASLAAVSVDASRQFEQLKTQSERLEEENKILRGQLVQEIAGQRIIAHGPRMRRALELAERVAPRAVPVLLRGESGTGKELVAKVLHLRSGRSGALIALNCAALPDSLLESELFGIEGGVATGVAARPGKFELADGGSLFLDEIGDMPPTTQVKLLRALQEREVVRVGGRRSIPVDVRVIAATHRNLAALVQQQAFREDLYYRLKGVELELPALRERREDIPHLVKAFSEEFARREGLEPVPFSAAALAALFEADWPGNVRELRNLIDAALSLADGEVSLELVRSLLGGRGPAGDSEPLDLEQVMERHIARVLELTKGNKSEAARLLGVHRRTLLRKGY